MMYEPETVEGAVTLNADRIVTVSANTLAVGGAIGGAFSLNKAGSGALTLSGVNTFGGVGKNFTLSAGTLNINNAAAFGNERVPHEYSTTAPADRN